MKHHLIKSIISKIKTSKAQKAAQEEAAEAAPQELDPEQQAALREAAEAPRKEAQRREEQRQRERRALEEAMAQEHAPKGDPASDFKTALYATCALYHPQISGIASLGVLSGLMGRVGYGKGLPAGGEEACRKVLSELVEEQALVKLPGFEVYATPGQVEKGEAKVTAREESDFLGEERAKRYVFHVAGANGEDYLLKSRIVILPGDTVEYQ
ncbi:MAG: hypothetical protein ACI4NA_00505, partial [Succinivibrio sp.]